MKTAVTISTCRQIGPEDYRMYRDTFIFDTSMSLDEIMKICKVNNPTMLEFSTLTEVKEK